MALPPLVNSSWSAANAGDGVIVPTVGDAQEKPQEHMPGSAAGARPDGYTTAAQAVYPTLTGVGAGRLPVAERPATFSSDTPPDFPEWHSAYQVEWLKIRATLASTGFQPTYEMLNGSGQTQAFYTLTQDDRPVNLMTMTKADYGRLSDYDKADETNRIGRYLSDLGRLDQLGLTFDYATTTAALSSLQIAIWSSGLPAADRAVFLGQFQLLRNGNPGDSTVVFDAEMMANIAGAIATDVFAERIAAISERLDRAIRFHSTPDPVEVHTEARVVIQRRELVMLDPTTDLRDTVGSASMILNGNSTDGAATIHRGYAEFMRAERAILASQTLRSMQAAAAFSDPRMDVANLINFFQQQYEDESRAIADAGTEEIRQLNKLLQDYALMQQLVQKQIGFYDPANPEVKRRFMNVGSYTNGDTVAGQFIDLESNDVQNVVGLQYTLWDTAANTLVVGSYGGTSVAALNEIKNTRNVPRFHWSLIMEGSSSLKTMAELAAEVGRAGRTPAWTDNELNSTQAAALSMFIGDGILSGGGRGNNRTHPLEALYGANRPLINILDRRLEVGEDSLLLMTKNEWDSFATQLNETVTILNQQNQIRQNEIQNAEKQANRHFELGNNALRKMNDILMSIGRI